VYRIMKLGGEMVAEYPQDKLWSAYYAIDDLIVTAQEGANNNADEYRDPYYMVEVYGSEHPISIDWRWKGDADNRMKQSFSK
jgi:hypothetical protein